jgi:TPR repeat protein
MYNIGGQGVPQDYAEAVKWYRKAADQGNAEAQFWLGAAYYLNRGVPQDYAEAVKWYGKAADQGNAAAQASLGAMYSVGQGVPQDYVQSHKWLNLAASRIPASDAEREVVVKLRDAVAAEMTPAQIAEAQKRAREWKPKRTE